jgi:hypothetical protein
VILSGIYWIYRGGELLEIIPPFLIGFGLIGMVYFNKKKKREGSDGQQGER